jgi:peptidoglycan lytic transglycosylase G
VTDLRTDVDDQSDGYEYELLKPETSTGRRVAWVLLGVLAVIAIVAGAFTYWVTHQVNPPGPPGAEVRVTVPTGSSTAAIATLLEDHDVISNSTVFRYYVRMKGGGSFLAGDFVFHKNSSMGTALDVLKGGPLPPPSMKFTVPPGLTLPEIAAKLAEQFPTIPKDTITQVLASGQVRSRYEPLGTTNLEGFLYPDTYEVGEGTDATALVQRLITQFDDVAAAAGMDAGYPPLQLTPYQVLIVASLIEREAKIPEDQAKIARVIYNRLQQNIPLGVDATLCYYLAEKPCSLTTSDLKADEPYNTRIHTGLVPTPIANPGLGAIGAALHPADGPWIYYVLDPNAATPGGHFFTDSASEFERVKQECERAGLGCG